MILDVVRLLFFPALMAFAAASDLFTMTISNRVSLALAAGFLALALASGMGAEPAFGGQPQPNIPAGFDTEGFLRQAKLNFVKLQAVHDSGKLGELREFTSDAMFASIKQDLLQHGGVGQQTDVVTLNAELLEALTEGDTHWASVRFSGMIRETPESQPEAFQEIWNLAKPVSGATGWVLAGIQQIQ